MRPGGWRDKHMKNVGITTILFIFTGCYLCLIRLYKLFQGEKNPRDDLGTGRSGVRLC